MTTAQHADIASANVVMFVSGMQMSHCRKRQAAYGSQGRADESIYHGHCFRSSRRPWTDGHGILGTYRDIVSVGGHVHDRRSSEERSLGTYDEISEVSDFFLGWCTTALPRRHITPAWPRDSLCPDTFSSQILVDHYEKTSLVRTRR